MLAKGLDLADWANQLSFENYYESWERTAATVVPARFDSSLVSSPG
jgi:hypothetical protein